MRIGIGGKLGPVRLGVSTRGIGGGVGPLSAGTSWKSRKSRKQSPGAGSVIGVLFLSAGIVVAVAVGLVILPFYLVYVVVRALRHRNDPIETPGVEVDEARAALPAAAPPQIASPPDRAALGEPYVRTIVEMMHEVVASMTWTRAVLDTEGDETRMSVMHPNGSVSPVRCAEDIWVQCMALKETQEILVRPGEGVQLVITHDNPNLVLVTDTGVRFPRTWLVEIAPIGTSYGVS